MRILTSALENLPAMPFAAFGRESLTGPASGPPVSVLINRCRKANTSTLLKEIYFKALNPSLDQTKDRFDRLGNKPAETLQVRLGFTLPRLAPSSKLSKVLGTCSEAEKTVPPIKTPGPHIRCTKTSPQQTDPPIGGSRSIA